MTARRRKLDEIYRLLRASHGKCPRGTCRPVVDCLIATILSQNTSGANSSAGFANLKQRFATWDDCADAQVRTIRRCIEVSGLSRIKAPRIRSILRQIRSQDSRADLEHLRDWPTGRAYEFLLDFDGVGPKTALCVMLFALGRQVFPVDTHIYRIAKRLGLLADSVPAHRAHEVLTPLIAPQRRYAMHVLLIAHGRQVCLARNPRCDRCRLAKLCPAGEGGVETGAL